MINVSRCVGRVDISLRRAIDRAERDGIATWMVNTDAGFDIGAWIYDDDSEETYGHSQAELYNNDERDVESAPRAGIEKDASNAFAAAAPPILYNLPDAQQHHGSTSIAPPPYPVPDDTASIVTPQFCFAADFFCDHGGDDCNNQSGSNAGVEYVCIARYRCGQPGHRVVQYSNPALLPDRNQASGGGCTNIVALGFVFFMVVKGAV